jgi:subtilisin family serine protease
MLLFKLLLLGCTVLGAPKKDENLPPRSEVVPHTYSVYVKWDSEKSAEAHAGWATSLHEKDHGGLSGVQNVFTFNQIRMKGYWGEFTDEVINKIRKDREVSSTNLGVASGEHGQMSEIMIWQVEEVVPTVKRRRTKTHTEPDADPEIQGKRNPKLKSTDSWFWKKPGNPRLKINHDKHAIRQPNEILEQTNAPWGLSRISKSDFGRFKYPASAAAGIYIYILDTGVDLNHKDFQGRAEFGYDATLQRIPPGFNFTQQIPIHGTHVASTAAGARWGVAKNARIVDVKVFREPEEADYVDHDNVQKDGLDWAVRDIIHRNRVGKAVINISWGWTQNGPHDLGCKRLASSINNAIDVGIPVVIAAGNEDISASYSCPPNAWRALTVGATDEHNQRLHRPDPDGPNGEEELNSSNWGPVVDIFAPGARIEAAKAGTWNEHTAMTGTSMAAPHVAGVIATWLGQQEHTKSVGDVEKKIFDLSQKGIVGDSKESKNRLRISRTQSEMQHVILNSSDPRSIPAVMIKW